MSPRMKIDTSTVQKDDRVLTFGHSNLVTYKQLDITVLKNSITSVEHVFSLVHVLSCTSSSKVKGKGKLFLLPARLWPRGWVEVQLYFSMTTALAGWSAARPGCTLPPGKTQYPLYGRLGGPQGWSGRAENLAPPGFDSRTVQPAVSCYTD